jgi:8-oxo-dGTP pyrophosphatase MutT (NUDIX family)
MHAPLFVHSASTNMPFSSASTQVLSSGLVVVHFDGARYRLLAVRAFASWDFPKTGLAEGDDPQATALSATGELTGLTDLELAWDDDHRDTLAAEDRSVTRYYLAESKTAEVILRVPPGDGGAEDFEYRWVTAEEAEEILPPRLAVILEWALGRLARSARRGA